MIDFHTVYQAHARDLHRFALYLSGDPALADDLVAESFVRLWTARGEIRTETIKGYLLAIVRNLYLTSRRQSGRLSALDEDVTPLADPTQPIDARLMHREELARVRRVLATLSEIDRSALLLRAFEGLSYEDIARVLDITIAAAKVKVHRARLRLAADLTLEEKVP
jgi:RNA polymerase sigma-70 factor (ECF subfamily)